MNVPDIIREALRIARTNRSLWLFGFFLGLGSSGSGSGAPDGPSTAGAAAVSDPALLLIALAIIGLVIAGLIMRLLSEGALIEGVVRVRRGVAFSVGEGFSEGWGHVGTVLLIKLAFFGVSFGSAVLLALPFVLGARFFGAFVAAMMFGIPAALVAVPWLVTLYIWHAFALRIAVLEGRRAMDAIEKARLFLHGRLLHGLKLVIATLLGTILLGLVGIVVIAPLVLLVAGSSEISVPLAIALGAFLLIPAFAVIAALIGTYQSSVWTIGYLTQVEA